MLTDLILQVTAIWIFYVLRQVGKKSKAWRLAWQLNHVFDLHKFSLDRWWRICFNGLEHDLVQFRSFNFLAPVFVYLNGRFKCFEYTLFAQGRSVNNRNIYKGGNPLFDQFGKFVGARVVFLNQIPLVDQDHHALFIAHHQVEDGYILRFHTTGSIEHQHTDV